ncbi:MAG: heavy metal translocating P-type ATPase [Cocleimonas sp.]
MNHTNCYHCGLPANGTPPFFTTLSGEKQVFCCNGCKAVCEAIISSGNADYYTHRETSAKTFDSSQLPKLLNQLRLYDNEKIQSKFVRKDKNNEWKEAWLILEEIHCAACMWLNERTIRQLDGVLDVQMDYMSQQTKVRWDHKKIKLSEILKAITNIGYHAHPFDPEQRESLNKEQKQRSIKRIMFALILGMLVMQSAIAGYFMGAVNQQGELPLWIQVSRWSSIFATAAILLYPGQIFFINAWRDLKNKTLGMDVPIAIGLSVAWLGSLYATIKERGDVYFESIAMFVIFLLIARYIELRSRITATALLDRSTKIIPQTTSLVFENEVRTVPVIELTIGDRVQVSPGEAVPVDGVLLSAKSSFDESLLTGESSPVVHIANERVLGGSINIEQLIEVEVISTKGDSTLSEIQQLAKNSTSFRPYYVDIAEQVAGKFVATILLIALSTFLFWFWKDGFNDISNALSNSVSVLIVTCPCALALAAPVALSHGAAGLSQLHVLAIRMSSIEKFAQVDTIVFDKTGTLTTGNPIVKEIKRLGEMDENEYLSIAASLEQGSHHPFAKAILKYHKSNYAKKGGVPFDPNIDIVVHAGQGIEAKLHQSKWRIGNESFASKLFSGRNKEQQNGLSKVIKEWRTNGDSVVYLSNNDGMQAIFCIADPLRDGVTMFLKQLNKLGVKRKVILSGDHQQSVDAVAKKLNISNAKGSLSPQEKLEWIKKEQQSGRSIMMLGDGINDAPTLAIADISLTFSDATDLAKNNSDLLILEKNYNTLGDAFQLMQRTRNTILQNLSWAVAYNLVAIPAAAIGWVTPWMAAIGMSFSSLLVVLNSLRLKKRY